MIGSFEVGKKYNGNYHQEGIRLQYNKGFTLEVFLPQLSIAEILGFKTGKYKFALTEIDGILFFLSEFRGAISMSDSPFHFGLYNNKESMANDLPKELGEDMGLSLNIIVVDSQTGIIKALRLVGLSTNFSKELIRICLLQSKQDINKLDYNRKLLEIQNKYSSSAIYKMSTIKN